jgi:hypothetical protein
MTIVGKVTRKQKKIRYCPVCMRYYIGGKNSTVHTRRTGHKLQHIKSGSELGRKLLETHRKGINYISA